MTQTTVIQRVSRMIIASMLIMGISTAAHAVLFSEDLGNFPDAIAVNAEFDTFGTRVVNGIDIDGKTGFLFQLQNTSFAAAGDPAVHFRNDPDGDFASRDVLKADAAVAIGAAQPFGIFEFGTNMETMVAQDLKNGILMAIAPTGWELNVEGLAGSDPEVNFQINTNFPDGLLFDDDATGISTLFTNPRFGTLEFFLEVNKSLDDILDATSASINERGLDVMTTMAWVSGGNVVTTFNAPGQSFDGEELRPRGQLVAVPEPGSVVLFCSSLIGLVACRKRKQRKV